MLLPSIGSTASITKTISIDDVDDFARLSGDTNPVHLDDSYAATSRFGRRIAHGLLVASLISAVLGTRLPGPGSVYLNQTLTFKSPVFPGDEVTALVEVIRIREDKPIVTIRTTCTNQAGQVVLEGEAILLVPD